MVMPPFEWSRDVVVVLMFLRNNRPAETPALCKV
jgi:hypothetical protein